MALAGGLLAGAAGAADGVAAPSDIAAAEGLFRDARARLAAGDVNGACEKFAESERLDPSSGTLINLAACHERQGKIATAWAEFLSAGRMATTQHKPKRTREAETRAKDLEARLSYLTIMVANPLPDMEIRQDDLRLEAGHIGSPVPVDPGVHQVDVSAPGYEPVRLTVTIGPVSDRQTAEIPEMAKVPAAVAVVPVTEPPPAKKPVPAAPRPPAHTVVQSEKDRTLGWVVAGAGAAFAVTGGVLYALALSANDKAESNCGYQGHYACEPEAAKEGAKRDTYATLATVSGALGIVGLGTGLWLILSPGERPAAVPAGAHAPEPVRVGITGSSLVVRGAFW